MHISSCLEFWSVCQMSIVNIHTCGYYIDTLNMVAPVGKEFMGMRSMRSWLDIHHMRHPKGVEFVTLQ